MDDGGMIVTDETGKCDWFDKPECACPYVHLHVDGCCLEAHYEPDGSVHVLADAGDWNDETTIQATDLDDARRQALEWFNLNHPSEQAA